MKVRQTLSMVSLLALVFLSIATEARPRVVVSSDIGGTDKDDTQSMVHLLLYSDVIDIRALISSPPGLGRRSHIRDVINEYRADYSKLKSYSSAYPNPDDLDDRVYQGALDPAPSAGYRSSTSGSRAIIAAARESSSAPLYVLVWGGMTDLAQALHDAPDIVPKIRVYFVGGCGVDSTCGYNYNEDRYSRDYVYKNMAKGKPFENLWMIEADDSVRGMYISSSGANTPSIHVPWIDANARDHGALGNYFKLYTQDLYPHSSKVTNGLKMGDTPSLLYLLDSVNDDDPTLGSWGGRFKRSTYAKNYWRDTSDTAHKLGSYFGAKAVYQHRSAVLASFAARFDRARVAKSSPTPSPSPTPSSSKIVTCESVNYGATTCSTGVTIKSVTVDTQLSSTKCVLNQTYTFGSNSITAKSGCRARFKVTY